MVRNENRYFYSSETSSCAVCPKNSQNILASGGCFRVNPESKAILPPFLQGRVVPIGLTRALHGASMRATELCRDTAHGRNSEPGLGDSCGSLRYGGCQILSALYDTRQSLGATRHKIVTQKYGKYSLRFELNPGRADERLPVESDFLRKPLIGISFNGGSI